MAKYQAPKGTKDVLPSQSYKWQYVEALIRELCALYGFRETRTPVFEHTELFLRGVGDTTDIVQKEMYTFIDKGDRSITLKPEGTAGVARMFLENSLQMEPMPQKYYYLNCPVFRYDKPQAGRLREHHQFGVEVYGATEASVDAECIFLALSLFKKLGITGLSVHINSIGCNGEDCRPKYNDALKEYFRVNYDKLCPTCKTRFEKNPLRILDCKEQGCKALAKDAPHIVDCLCDECKAHFEELKACLDALGVDYVVDPFIVRGLDYYTKTVFEIIVHTDKYTDTVCGGGRYDGLIAQLGGPELCGIGFGMGIERLLLVAEQFKPIPEPQCASVYIAPMGGNARHEGIKLIKQLRENGISAEFDHVGRSFKAQFKYADKLKARLVAVLGEDELQSGQIKLKDMSNGEETTVKLFDFLPEVKRLLS